MNFDQTLLRWAGGWIFDGAGGENERLFSGAFKDGVTGSPKGGVESQDSHGKSVPNGVRLSREAVELGLTLKKWRLI